MTDVVKQLFERNPPHPGDGDVVVTGEMIVWFEPSDFINIMPPPSFFEALNIVPDRRPFSGAP